MTIGRLKFYVALAALMAFTSSAIAAGEQSDQPPRSAAAGQPAPQSTKPPRRADKAQTSPWTLQDALPDRSVALRSDTPSTDPGLGRVPLRSGQGSFGFETETHVKASQGTVIPSLQANQSRLRPFMGLSLSVPTSDK
jgi:hypothetical protein